jgi:hypothetical protein
MFAKVFTLAVITAISLTACSGSGSGSVGKAKPGNDSSYSSSEEAVNKVIEAGLTCNLPSWKTKTDTWSGVENDEAECTDDNGDVYYIKVFASESALNDYLNFYCNDALSEIGNFTDLFGKNWSTDGTHDQVSLNDLNQVLGGSIATYEKKCSELN